MKNKLNTRTLVMSALLIALQIVFVRFLSIDTGIVRISLGFLPIAIAGMIFGPLGGGLIGVLADIIGMLIFSRGQVYFFPFTISEFLYGFGFGLFLHNRNISLLRISLCIAVQFVLINLCLSSFWLYLYNLMILATDKAFWAIFYPRLLAAAVSLPLQIIIINLIYRYIRLPLKKLGWLKENTHAKS